MGDFVFVACTCNGLLIEKLNQNVSLALIVFTFWNLISAQIPFWFLPWMFLLSAVCRSLVNFALVFGITTPKVWKREKFQLFIIFGSQITFQAKHCVFLKKFDIRFVFGQSIRRPCWRTNSPFPALSACFCVAKLPVSQTRTVTTASFYYWKNDFQNEIWWILQFHLNFR